MKQLKFMIAGFQQAITTNQLSTFVPASRINGTILDILLQEGFIRRYFTINNKSMFYIEFYSYRNKRVIKQMDKVFTKKGDFIYYGYEDLLKIPSITTFAIMSTTKGVISHKEALRLKCGGLLLFSFFF